MKILFDFLPIALFFGMFKFAESNKDWAAATATEWLGFMVSGGVVGSSEAPVLLATVVVIVATFGQILWLKARGRKVDAMLWVSLGLVTMLGGATIYFHSENFIKWKPTVLYWVMGGALLVGQLVFRKNGIKSLMSAQMALPDPVWRIVNLSWVGFFTVMGFLNLWVAFNFSTSTWVNFKLFGGLGLMMVFVLAQALYLNKHIKPGTTP
ncbi:septation protein A [Polaromonas sp. JS666]|uniref:septation protein A n=1 Tax=Polaromonas sp. (strain JS666 / ATCC BAA-500) TaxID=296591 RepID=UPI0002F98D5F|nr:septation protein A [Polaromonas sp. JS666]UUZ70781.1 septation protein A [Polaromonas sp. P1(28)-8]